jgi:hypothetical protein
MDRTRGVSFPRGRPTKLHDRLVPEQVILLQLGTYLDHALIPALMKLADDVCADTVMELEHSK